MYAWPSGPQPTIQINQAQASTTWRPRSCQVRWISMSIFRRWGPPLRKMQRLRRVQRNQCLRFQRSQCLRKQPCLRVQTRNQVCLRVQIRNQVCRRVLRNQCLRVRQRRRVRNHVPQRAMLILLQLLWLRTQMQHNRSHLT